MPELAEVEFYRKRWSAGHGDRIAAVLVHPRARVFRDCDAAALKSKLTGATLLDSETAAKQMLFRFSEGKLSPVESVGWLGLHLGMSGELRVEPPDYQSRKHDHLVLKQEKRSLVFTDPRMFGAVQFAIGPDAPDWWTKIAPAILSPAFSVDAVAEFLRRRPGRRSRPCCSCRSASPASATGWPTRFSGGLRFTQNAQRVRSLRRKSARCIASAARSASWLSTRSPAKAAPCRPISTSTFRDRGCFSIAGRMAGVVRARE